jgi:hypothetical protein
MNTLIAASLVALLFGEWGRTFVEQWSLIRNLAGEDQHVKGLADQALEIRWSATLHNSAVLALCHVPQAHPILIGSAARIETLWSAYLIHVGQYGSTQHAQLTRFSGCPAGLPMLKWSHEPWIRFISSSGKSGFSSQGQNWTYSK